MGQPNILVSLPVIIVTVFARVTNAVFTRMVTVMPFRASKIIFTLSELQLKNQITKLQLELICGANFVTTFEKKQATEIIIMSSSMSQDRHLMMKLQI